MSLAFVLRDPNFWVCVSFSIFVGAAFFPAKRKMLAFFKERQEKIRLQIQEAEEILREATQLDEEATRYFDEVEGQIQEMLVLAERESSHLREKFKKEKEQIQLAHQHLLEEHQKILISKLEQELRHILLGRAFQEASSLFVATPPSFNFSEIETVLQKGTGFFR
ncbi:MAG: ATP synthase F0 subunit B [Alphaproteobacteria bacterium]